MAAVGLRSLALLVGAGYTGTYVYNNLTFDRARKIATEILTRHRDSSDTSSSSSSNSSTSNTKTAVDALTNQVDRLTREMTRGRNDQVLVVGGNGSTGYRASIGVVSDMINLLGWVVVIISTGGVIYYIGIRKRLSLHDLLWVSQTKFNNTINSMQSGIQKVSGIIKNVKNELNSKLVKVEHKVDTVEKNLSQQIDVQVGDVQSGVNNLSSDISVISRGVDHVHVRIDEINHKIDGTNKGVQLLIDFISSLAPDKVKPGTPFYNLKKFMNNSTDHADRQIEDQSGLRPRISQGLAGLLTSNTTTPTNLTNGNANGTSSPPPSSSQQHLQHSNQNNNNNRQSLDIPSSSAWPTA